MVKRKASRRLWTPRCSLDISPPAAPRARSQGPGTRRRAGRSRRRPVLRPRRFRVDRLHLAGQFQETRGMREGTGGMADPRHLRKFTAEFKRHIVEMHNAGKPPREIMEEYDLGGPTLRRGINSINATGSPRAAGRPAPLGRTPPICQTSSAASSTAGPQGPHPTCASVRCFCQS